MIAKQKYVQFDDKDTRLFCKAKSVTHRFYVIDIMWWYVRAIWIFLWNTEIFFKEITLLMGCIGTNSDHDSGDKLVVKAPFSGLMGK